MKAAAALLLLISFYLFGGPALRAVLPQQGGVHVNQFNRTGKSTALAATASVQKQGDASFVSLSDLDDEDDILRKFVPLVKWLVALSIALVLHVLCQAYKPRLPSLLHSPLSSTDRLSRLSIFRI